MNAQPFRTHLKTEGLAMQPCFTIGSALLAFRAGLCAVALCVPVAGFAFDSGSTGADGALNPAVNIEIPLPESGILNYTTINIPAGVTVRFRRNALNTPVVLLASGSVTVAGTIDVSGGTGKDVGTTGDGNVADDGLPGLGGPGGFDGGRGGRADPEVRPSVVDGGPGLGPGGGQGGRTIGTTYTSPNGYRCADNRYQPYASYGLGAGFASPGPDALFLAGQCTGTSPAADAYGSQTIQPLIGGSGGGGGRGSETLAGAGGGGGGGALLIAATGTLTITGTIVADGGDAGRQGSSGYGGGGSGGAIRLVATTIAGTGSLSAAPGCGQSSGGTNCDSQSDRGSFGRIRLQAETLTFTGGANPVFSSDLPTALELNAGISLRVASIAGVQVPATPTGIGDVVLPADLTNPVSVTLQTVNVPLGSTIKVRVVPASGLPVDAVSSPVTGSLGAGSATASISLPQGPSRLEASTSFTVPAQLQSWLKRLLPDEEALAIELALQGGGRSQAYLVTASGRRLLLPADALRAAGIAG